MIKVLRTAKSKGGKYAAQLVRESDGTFSVRSTTGGRHTSSAVGMTEEQARVRFEKELAWSKTDGINLIEEKAS